MLVCSQISVEMAREMSEEYLDFIVPLLWFSRHGSSGNYFLHSTVWWEMQRTEGMKSGEQVGKEERGEVKRDKETVRKGNSDF